MEEHPEYSNGPALRPIILAQTNPGPGDKCLTAGWGLTGYNEGASVELRSAELTVASAVGNWVYTSNYDDEGRLTDTGGDAGGPLACWRDGVWEIVGVLKGEGCDCRTNTTNGDGQWSSVAVQRTWVFNQLTDSPSMSPAPIAVDSFWSPWSTWSSCSRSCGGGSRNRDRSCTPPIAEGRPCSGRAQDEEECGTERCPG